MQGLQIDIAELAGKPGAGKAVRVSVAVEGLRGALAWVGDDDPIDLDLSLDRVEEGIAVFGKISGRAQLTCSRCLVGYEQPFERTADEIYCFSADVAARTEGYAVEDMTVDLEPMVRDLVVLELPVNPLHSADCAGLCTVCGADLNLEDCGHRKRALDARWAPLESMLAERLQSENK